MNLHHLRYFLKLAQLEHYTRAAEELHITQPSLSHAMSALEEKLGVPLFEKSGRNVKLTKYGNWFLRDVRDSLRILDTGVDKLRMIGDGEGLIELGFLRTLGVDLIPALIEEFIKSNPDNRIRFNLSTDSGLTADLLEGLKARRYDLVFCTRVDNEPEIDFAHIASQELVVIVPTEHPLAERKAVSLDETLPYPQVIFKKKSGMRHIVDNLFRQIDAFPKVSMEVEEEQVVAGFVARGFGIAVVSNMRFLQSMRVKALKITKPSWERQFHLAMLASSYNAPAVVRFREFALNMARNRGLALDIDGLVNSRP